MLNIAIQDILKAIIKNKDFIKDLDAIKDIKEEEEGEEASLASFNTSKFNNYYIYILINY